MEYYFLTQGSQGTYTSMFIQKIPKLANKFQTNHDDTIHERG